MKEEKRITQSYINEEFDKLSTLISDGKIEVPSMHKVLAPGFIVFLWMAICPWIVFGINDSAGDDRSFASAFSSFTGLIIFFSLSNLMNLCLSVPGEFRSSSLFMRLLKRKGMTYISLWFFYVLILSILGSSSSLGALAFGILLVFGMVFSIFIIQIDFGRYQVIAFLSIMSRLKRKS